MTKERGDGPVDCPVRNQFATCNARDIGAFMRIWSADCQCLAFPRPAGASGTLAFPARDVARFAESQLPADLVRRIRAAVGAVDPKIVTRTFVDGPGEVEVVAIYDVVDGRIVRVWFRTGHPRQFRDVGIGRACHSDAALVRNLTRAAYSRWVPVIGREPMPMAVDHAARVRDTASTGRMPGTVWWT